MPRATTAAWEVLPPREVRILTEAKKPWMSSGLVYTDEDNLEPLLLAEHLGAVGVEARDVGGGTGGGRQAEGDGVTLASGSRRGHKQRDRLVFRATDCRTMCGGRGGS